MFSLHLYKSSGAGRVWCFIRKNGRGVVYAEVPAESKIGYYESSTSTVLHLGSDDKVDIGNCHGVSDISSITTFTGFLLKDG